MSTIAWTTPRTWVTGEIPTASQFNTDLRNNQNFLLNIPRVRAVNAGYTLYFYNGVYNLFTTGKLYDTDNMWLSNSNFVLLINTDGLYRFGSSWAHLSHNGHGLRENKCSIWDETLGIYTGEAFRINYDLGVHGGSENQHCFVEGQSEYALQGLHQLVFFYFQNTSANIDLFGTGDESTPTMWATWMGA